MIITKNTMLSSSIATLYENEDQNKLEKAMYLFKKKDYEGSIFLYEKLEIRAKRIGLILELLENIDHILSINTYMPNEYREKLCDLRVSLKHKKDQIITKERLKDGNLNKPPESPTDSEDEVCAENGDSEKTIYPRGGLTP